MSYQKRLEDTLARAVTLAIDHDAGIGPRRGGQFRQFADYASHGYLRFVGWGRDIDGEAERDVQIYELTPAGAELALREARGRVEHAEALASRPLPTDRRSRAYAEHVIASLPYHREWVAKCERALERAASAAKAVA